MARIDRSSLYLVALVAINVACTSPEAPRPRKRPATNSMSLVPIERFEKIHVPLTPTPERRARLLRAAAQPRISAVASNVEALAAPVTGARFTAGRGQALIDALAAMPQSRSRFGVGALTFNQVYGATSICEDPMIDLQLEYPARGERFEARYRTQPFVWVTTPTTSLYALSSTCTGALLAAGSMPGTAVQAGCSREDEAAHFPANSACRACLAVDGDHARCVASGGCKRLMNREVLVGTTFYDVLGSLALQCAPDFLGEFLVLARELGENNEIPAAFDHNAIAYWCQYFWDPLGGAPDTNCIGSAGRVRPAYADVTSGWAEYIRRPGDTGDYYYDRLWIASRVEVGGLNFEGMPLFPGTVAELSTMDRRAGGWGFNPREMRPDGLDYARDWMSAVGLKTATNIAGISVSAFNRNLCPEDAWKGPDEKGRYFCGSASYDDAHRPPDEERWSYDYGAFNISVNPPVVEMAPTVTMAATGYSDPRIPGGHILHILGSTSLADPDWENCRWPDVFEPDEMSNGDTLDLVYYTFTSQTYRFGKDPRFDIRVALTTNQHRGYCWEALPDL